MRIEVILISFSFLEKLIKNLQVFNAIFSRPERVCPLFFIPYGFENLFGRFGIIPEIGGRSEFFLFGYGKELVFNVKETSSEHPALTEALSNDH
jgi:hypothetical protein